MRNSPTHQAAPGQAPSHVHVRSSRRILCVYPRYLPTFSTFHNSYPMLPGVKAFMTPLGLLQVAAYLPSGWEIRFVDENVRHALDADYLWSDAVLISGMHAQREQTNEINARAHSFGKLTVLGGPSVSRCPDYYPDVDIIHQGEIGDATDRLIEYLDATVERPSRQMGFETVERLPLEDLPVPAYSLVNTRQYCVVSMQSSSGCPHQCEFCDVPGLYGRRPRSKTPRQITAELDAVLESGGRGPVYFIDDDFIANPMAAKRLLEELVEWQRRRGFPTEFVCEATLSLAQRRDILEMMRDAGFTTVFCGVESPEPNTLRAIGKEHNLRRPLLEAVRTINSYGMEVSAGIILGFDTDTPETADAVIDFVRESNIPLLTINLLYALPNTALYRRLREEGRLVEDPTRESNVLFRLPYDVVLSGWRKCLQEVYSPHNLLKRYSYQTQHTYPNRRLRRKVHLSDVALGARLLARILWHVGCRSDYRGEFWRTAGPLLRAGRIEDVVHIGFAGHHLISFARGCVGGEAEPCFYGDPSRSRFNASHARSS